MYNMYSYMCNMYIDNNYISLYIVFDFEHVPVSLSHNERKVSSQSEHSTSKAWMLKDSKGSVTKLGSRTKFGVGSIPSAHKSKCLFKVSSTVEDYESIYIKGIVRVLTSNDTYCSLPYWTELQCYSTVLKKNTSIESLITLLFCT